MNYADVAEHAEFLPRAETPPLTAADMEEGWSNGREIEGEI